MKKSHATATAQGKIPYEAVGQDVESYLHPLGGIVIGEPPESGRLKKKVKPSFSHQRGASYASSFGSSLEACYHTFLYHLLLTKGEPATHRLSTHPSKPATIPSSTIPPAAVPSVGIPQNLPVNLVEVIKMLQGEHIALPLLKSLNRWNSPRSFRSLSKYFPFLYSFFIFSSSLLTFCFVFDSSLFMQLFSLLPTFHPEATFTMRSVNPSMKKVTELEVDINTIKRELDKVKMEIAFLERSSDNEIDLLKEEISSLEENQKMQPLYGQRGSVSCKGTGCWMCRLLISLTRTRTRSFRLGS